MLISPAHTHRYRRFADALTGAHARLAEKRGWLVLRFSGLSPPILCQLAWRTVPPPISWRLFHVVLPARHQQMSIFGWNGLTEAGNSHGTWRFGPGGKSREKSLHFS